MVESGTASPRSLSVSIRQLKEISMRLSGRRIRSINRTLAAVNGRSIYNNDKPLHPAVPDRRFTRIVYVAPSQL
jgi:hypothetical protein